MSAGILVLLTKGKAVKKEKSEEKPKAKKGASDDLLEQLKASLEAIKN